MSLETDDDHPTMFQAARPYHGPYCNRILVMVNGPALLEANLKLEIHHFRLQASNHTLSPLKEVNPSHIQAAINCWASSWTAKALSQVAWRRFNLYSRTGRGEFRQTVESVRFEAHHEIEQGLSGDGVWLMIMGEFGIRNKIRP